MTAVAVYALAVVAAAALFLLAPQLDLWVSGLFFRPGRGFVLRNWPPAAFVHHLVPWLVMAIFLVVAVAVAWLVLMKRPLWRFDRKALLFVVLSTALGPGFFANTVLKDHWGRARPEQVQAFGGPRRFTPAPLPATQCPRNCSFVSGDAALGFSVVAFAFLLPPGIARRRAIAAALGFGAFLGLVRIAQGGHFLSDVVWAGLVVFGTAAALRWWVVDRDGLASPAAMRLYRLAGSTLAVTGRELSRSEAGRTAAAVGLTGVVIVLSITFVDRPVALYLHQKGPDLHALFALISRLGEAWGWLLLFALGFAALHWGGELPRLRGAAARLRAASAVPAFLFISVAAAGLAADILKLLLGRMRPKLLFSGGLYGFTGLAWRPDHWSFPSGHTATIAALAAALWWLWPRHLLFYVLVAAIVAASRIAVGAHYPSDVAAGALVAVLATRGAARLFALWRIDLATAARGAVGFGEVPPWPCRRWRTLAAGRRAAAAGNAGGPLAPPAQGGVSAGRDGAADRDL